MSCEPDLWLLLFIYHCIIISVIFDLYRTSFLIESRNKCFFVFNTIFSIFTIFSTVFSIWPLLYLLIDEIVWTADKLLFIVMKHRLGRLAPLPIKTLDERLKNQTKPSGQPPPPTLLPTPADDTDTIRRNDTYGRGPNVLTCVFPIDRQEAM